MQIVWLASYPRSGNTWLRFLLYAYLHGPIDNTAEVNRRIPPILRPLPPEALRATRLISKTHFERSPTHPMIERTLGVIHIRRHPKDVLLSGLNYHALNGSTLDPARYAQAFIARHGDPEWHRMGFGTWESNTTSWLGPDAHAPHVAAAPITTVGTIDGHAYHAVQSATAYVWRTMLVQTMNATAVRSPARTYRHASAAHTTALHAVEIAFPASRLSSNAKNTAAISTIAPMSCRTTRRIPTSTSTNSSPVIVCTEAETAAVPTYTHGGSEPSWKCARSAGDSPSASIDAVP